MSLSNDNPNKSEEKWHVCGICKTVLLLIIGVLVFLILTLMLVREYSYVSPDARRISHNLRKIEYQLAKIVDIYNQSSDISNTYEINCDYVPHFTFVNCECKNYTAYKNLSFIEPNEYTKNGSIPKCNMLNIYIDETRFNSSAILNIYNKCSKICRTKPLP